MACAIIWILHSVILMFITFGSSTTPPNVNILRQMCTYAESKGNELDIKYPGDLQKQLQLYGTDTKEIPATMLAEYEEKCAHTVFNAFALLTQVFTKPVKLSIEKGAKVDVLGQLPNLKGMYGSLDTFPKDKVNVPRKGLPESVKKIQ